MSQYLLLASLGIALAGCGVEEAPKHPCPLGAKTCACTTSGGCDPGLTCYPNRCVSPGTSPDGPASELEGAPPQPDGALTGTDGTPEADASSVDSPPQPQVDDGSSPSIPTESPCSQISGDYWAYNGSSSMNKTCTFRQGALLEFADRACSPPIDDDGVSCSSACERRYSCGDECDVTVRAQGHWTIDYKMCPPLLAFGYSSASVIAREPYPMFRFIPSPCAAKADAGAQGSVDGSVDVGASRPTDARVDASVPIPTDI
jgi:hypothetical protein